jgi:hypothetical protein
MAFYAGIRGWERDFGRAYSAGSDAEAAKAFMRNTELAMKRNLVIRTEESQQLPRVSIYIAYCLFAYFFSIQ